MIEILLRRFLDTFVYLFGYDLLVEILHLPLSQPVHLDVDRQVGFLLVQHYLPVR
jgi:hypothetical protein